MRNRYNIFTIHSHMCKPCAQIMISNSKMYATLSFNIYFALIIKGKKSKAYTNFEISVRFLKHEESDIKALLSLSFHLFIQVEKNKGLQLPEPCWRIHRFSSTTKQLQALTALLKLFVRRGYSSGVEVFRGVYRCLDVFGGVYRWWGV